MSESPPTGGAPAEDAPKAPAPPQEAPAPPQETPGEAPPPKPARTPPAQQAQENKQPTVVVRYGMMGTVGQFRHNLKAPPAPGMKVVVRTDRGVELGEIVTDVCEGPAGCCVAPQRLAEFLAACGSDYPFRRDGKVLRQANHQDIVDQRHLAGSAREEATFCRQQVEKLKLKMKLVAVEHLLGGERIVFYFSAESRVDFRELVRHLAAQYRTRIEMRQVGARDEARLVGDYERCGRQCCCRVFLKYLKPVSMRMAKMQKATLDPSKISGRCGRLMCCLRFEDTGYEELRAKLPHKNTWVRTSEVIGRVVDTQILTQLVRLETPEGTRVVVANEEIVERDVKPPPAPSAVPAGPPPGAGDARKERAVQPPPKAEEVSRPAGGTAKKRRRGSGGKSRPPSGPARREKRRRRKRK